MISYFEFNGKKSTDFGIKIFNELEFTPPTKRYERVEVQGRDGDLFIDLESRANIEKTIKFQVEVDGKPKDGSDGSLMFKRALDISKWLGVKGFYDFKYSMYPGFTYKAMIQDPYNLADTVRKKGIGIIKVIFEPVMYYDGYDEKKAISGASIDNIGSIVSKPKIRLIPSSSEFTITNNGVNWLRLTKLNLGEEIIIDSELGKAYTRTSNANNNMLVNDPLFPLLYVGKNQLSFTGAQVYITPRFGEEAI